MLSAYSCHDEGMCDCICPNYDCVYHKIHNKEKDGNQQWNSQSTLKD